jgi:hypothetical protein
MSEERTISNEISRVISFTPATYKKLAVWTVHFENGKEAMLYKCGGEWMQSHEGALEPPDLIAIGNQIDCMGSHEN